MKNIFQYVKAFVFGAICVMPLSAEQELIKQGSLGGFKGDSKIFSGEVNVEMMFETNEWRDFSGGLVKFSPKARSAWHTHPKGQTLIVVDGTIITGTQSGIVQVAHKGDVISCPPNVRHFHGAMPTQSGSHIALTSAIDGTNVVWGEKVSDSEYEKAVELSKENQ